MPDKALFMTQRSKVLEAYAAAGQPFSASTKPYKSTVSFQFHTSEATSGAGTYWMIASLGQTLEWFSYKLNDPVPDNSSLVGYRVANEADTNISKARTTNGAEDFIIEAMSASCRGIRTSIGAAAIATGLTINGDALDSLQGLLPIYDPASIYMSPQIQSPFNLQNGIYRTLAPYVSIEFEWDRSRIAKIGTLEQIPEGGANSYLNASGEPSTNDRYRIPEGYIWRREGEPDSEFIVRGILQDTIAIPMLTVAAPGLTTAPVFLNAAIIMVDSVLRLHGLSVKLPTRN
jgi:hypothetical protein